MKKFNFAVIGKDVSKSCSPEMHSFIAERLGYEINYDKISISEDEFDRRIGAIIGAYDGFNVTIPYKLSVIPHLRALDGDARTFKAVNTVYGKTLTGYNTDGMGFMLMLKNGGVEVAGKNILLLGAGGAGRSVAKKLSDGGATVFVYDRNAASSRALSDEFDGVTALSELEIKPYFAIVNATGVGMHKTEGVSPVAEEIIDNCEVAVDLIYTPPKSQFLKIAESLGKKIINGMAMLFYQAYFAECIYLNIRPDETQAKQMFIEYTGEKL